MCKQPENLREVLNGTVSLNGCIIIYGLHTYYYYYFQLLYSWPSLL